MRISTTPSASGKPLIGALRPRSASSSSGSPMDSSVRENVSPPEQGRKMKRLCVLSLLALAAHYPAGYHHFVELMNQKARSLGAFDSQFQNPHGLDTPGHYSSPWDMAIFARALLADPVLAAIVNTRRYALPWPNTPPLGL